MEKRPFRRLRSFLGLPLREKRIFLASLLLLPALRIGIRGIGLDRVRRFLAGTAPRHLHTAPRHLHTASRHLHTASRAARLVQAAASILPHAPTCLERSLALWRILHRRGIAGDLFIGVRPGAASHSAHAWLELQGVVVNDAPDVADHYAAFPIGMQ